MSDLQDLNKEALIKLQEMSEQTGTDLYSKLISIFINETPVRMAAVNKGWSEKNYKELGAAAHGLKSGATYLGAEKLAFLAAEIENNCSEENYIFDFAKNISQMEKTFLIAKAILEETTSGNGKIAS